MSPAHRRYLSSLLAALSLLAFLSIAGLAARQRLLTRGIPGELPGPFAGGADSPFGINVEMLAWDNTARESALAEIATAGFHWVKQPVPWGEGASEVLPEFERLLDAATGVGLEVVPRLDGDPAVGYAPPADPQVFAAWVGEFAALYGDRIEVYQVWDEPNLASHWGGEPVNPAKYAAMLAAVHDAITAADPGAVIVAAALAPTLESGPDNLSDLDYLAALYELGADAYFDAAAGKPYGFDTGPDDRRAAREILNFSRLVLLREVMEQHGDGDSALWAGNFGWNALPEGWTGRASIWGQTDVEAQASYTRAAYQRAIDEWPWSGVLFLESYAPAAAGDDPRWGFALVDRDLSPRSSLLVSAPGLDGGQPVIPGYQGPDPDSPYQTYTGEWRFRPTYGADVSQSGDRVRVEFEGTDFGLHVRRGDYRAYFYVAVDGRPANALPTDERGAYLCLTSPDRSANEVAMVPVARRLSPGRHTAEIVAERGWDQWALVGYTAANLPDERGFHWAAGLLGVAAVGLAAAAVWTGRAADWPRWLQSFIGRLGDAGQLTVTAVTAALFALSGWLAWLHPAGGPLRRLGDGPQTLVLAAAAALYYVSPWVLLNIVSGLALFLLICWRLDLGLALIALSAPFYVYPKPLAGYRFSMVEMVTLMTLAAWVIDAILGTRRKTFQPQVREALSSLLPLDWAVAALLLIATLSLLFAERLDVATNEWRMVVLEPGVFYLLLRTIKLGEKRRWRVADGFVLGGLVVAVLGLVWYAAGSHVITAEGGLPRLRSIYGSPNNVGLYLGRVAPLLLAVAVLGSGRRRWLYGLALLPTLAAVALSFSKGAILLGLPVGLGLVVILWRGRRAAAVLGGLAVLALIGLLIGSRIPALADRLTLGGATTDFRVSLWKASLQMIGDHPWTGVGLDNFLYAYRGTYIRPEAWQEPNLSHPHNLVLDYWVRLGVLGLAAGAWIQLAYWRLAHHLVKVSTRDLALAIGLVGSMGATLAHGLVDQSYFLIDLAYAFMMAAGLVASLHQSAQQE